MLIRSLFRPSTTALYNALLPRASMSAVNKPNNKLPPTPPSQMEKDDAEIKAYNDRKAIYKPYLRLVEQWKIPLEKKKLRQQRIQLIKQTKQKQAQQPEKIVIHNSAVGIQYPVDRNSYFCVVDIDGYQCKIMEDCRITIENRPELDLNDKVVFDKVLLLASKDFTCLGRPYLVNATVEAVVEEKPLSEKLIVLKKKRRKQYKRSHGVRAKLTVLRVSKINYKLGDEQLSRAVPLE